MRVVIVKDEEAQALVTKLELIQHRNAKYAKPEGISQANWDNILNEMHRSFHYAVVSWLQDVGCKVT